MDRVIQYPSAIPLVDDILRTNKNAMIALGVALQAILGGNTVFDGLGCTPTSPASMQVKVAPGSVYSVANVDGTAYGDLGSDTTHSTVKQGILLDTTLFTITAPTTTGNSINYLIQGAYQDQDTDSVVLPYFNSSNPTVAWAGPSNSGTSQNTTRKGALVLSLKAGTSATTGSQTTPAPDAGFTGLWVVTVANGAVSITSGNISLYSGAPFINYKLPQLSPSGPTGRTTLSTNANYYVSTTGNDGTGAGTSGSPWATIQHAVNFIQQNVDLAGFGCTINIANGTYTSPVVITQPFVGGIPTIQGNTSSPSSCIISTTSNDCFYVESGVAVNLGGFTLQTTTGGDGLHIDKNASVIITGAMNYGACAGDHIQNNDGNLLVAANYTISGNAQNHWDAGINGVIYTAGLTITVTGTPAFSSAFANAHEGGRIYCGSMTFSGSATGTQYLATFGGSVNTNTGGTANYLPGTTSTGSAPTGYYN